MNKEPLLKEEQEEIVASNRSNLKMKMPLIVTSIVGLIIVLFAYKVGKAFYVGFMYFDCDERHYTYVDEEETIINEEEVSLESLILKNTYNKINVNDEYLTNILYTTSLVDNLTIDVKLEIVLNYLNKDTLSYEEINNTFLSIFNSEIDDSLASNLSLHNYDITYENDMYNITNKQVIIENNKTITKATSLDDYLYIYETVNNNDYKWTYKKSSTEDYYFISITPL